MPITANGHRRAPTIASAASRHTSASAAELAADGGQVGDPEQVARRDPEQLATLPAAERRAASWPGPA